MITKGVQTVLYFYYRHLHLLSEISIRHMLDGVVVLTPHNTGTHILLGSPQPNQMYSKLTSIVPQTNETNR